MMRSISSMSVTIAVTSLSGAPDISMPSRSRASGVRKSCDTPARISARSSSMRARLPVIWLKARATTAISCGPLSACGGGVSPLPTMRAARASWRSGALIRATIR